MQELLFKYFRKRNSKVEYMSATMLKYEQENPQHNTEIYPLENDNVEVGIEIEVERVKSNIVHLYDIWQVKDDNSLRNSGKEYVTYPIKGKRIHYALNQFFACINAGIHFSPRTSIHVHVNVLDMLPKQIAALAVTYAPFEKLLYRFVGGNRDKNNFCVPLCDAERVSGVVEKFLKDDYVPTPNESYRYLGLNFDSVRKFGTVEFRHMGGTSDKVKIVKWINLLMRLKSYAMSHSYEQIQETVNRLNTDSSYLAFFRDVFGDQAALLDSSNLQRDMEENVSVIKHLITHNTFGEEIEKIPVKESYWYKRLTQPKETAMFSMYGITPRPRRGAPAPQRAVQVRERVDLAHHHVDVAEPADAGARYEAARNAILDWRPQVFMAGVAGDEENA